MVMDDHASFAKTLIKPSEISDANKVITLFFDPFSLLSSLGVGQVWGLNRVVRYLGSSLIRSCALACFLSTDHPDL